MIPSYSFLSQVTLCQCALLVSSLYDFDRVTTAIERLKSIFGMNKTTCSSDPFPTRLLMSLLHAIIRILQHIVNLCLTTVDLPIFLENHLL